MKYKGSNLQLTIKFDLINIHYRDLKLVLKCFFFLSSHQTIKSAVLIKYTGPDADGIKTSARGIYHNLATQKVALMKHLYLFNLGLVNHLI